MRSQGSKDVCTAILFHGFKTVTETETKVAALHPSHSGEQHTAGFFSSTSVGKKILNRRTGSLTFIPFCMLNTKTFQ